MAHKPNKQFLVVGAGLSGLCVAIQLLRKKQAVTIVDNGINHSSAVAAGLINPLVFRRMTKSWRVDEFIPYLKDFYPSIPNPTNQPLFNPITIRRFFSSEQERRMWINKQALPEFSLYMTTLNSADDNYNDTKNPFGSARVKQSGFVDTSAFLKVAKEHVFSSARVLKEEFDYTALEDGCYRGDQYDEVVFCEGYLGFKNPWFKNLPLNQTKGETLIIHAESLPENEALNRKCFVLPLGNKHFKIGSTYSWHNIDLIPSEEGREKILSNFRFLSDATVPVVDHEAGVRPTTFDRRPLLGTHPDQKNYHVFNGLGSKGYMIAPLLSKEFVDYLLEGRELHEEVKISRIYHGR